MTFQVTVLTFYLVLTLVQCYNQRDRLFLLQKPTGDATDSVLVATWKDGDIPTGCEIITDIEVIDNVISSSDSTKVRNLSEDDMKLLLDDCSQFHPREEKIVRMVEATTRMSIRDVIGNSYQELRRGKGEDSTSHKQWQGRRNNDRLNNSRVNDIETTTSLKDLKSSRRMNASTTSIGRYSTKAPRNAVERNPAKDNAMRTTTGRYSTEPTRSEIVRNSARENTRRTTSGRYSTEPTRNAIERNPAGENARRMTTGRYSTEPTRNSLERNPAGENARRMTTGRYSTEPTRKAIERNPTRENATTHRYPAESTTRTISTGRTRSSDVRTTTSENNLESSTIATSSSTVPGYNGIPIIMPGTKWCGAGDIAQDQKDLGRREETDKCCRDHDHCNDTLAPGETRGNLTNDSSFTLLNCQCDEEFYDCLHSSNSFISNTVGNLYFNILGRKCYKKDYPLVCKRYYTFFKITCREYESDTSEKRGYNWYPAKRYRKIFSK